MIMRNSKLRITTGISALALACLGSGAANAQAIPTSPEPEQEDTATAPDAAEDGGDIVVTGIRASIGRALDAKRSAGNLIDVINAEDIGKLPDQNVAESLARVPGISIARKDGEGSNFTVRGISLNRVEINGRAFVGATQDATPALETVSPEILSAIEVFKSPTADLVEGAIGATVNLKTRRPLDQFEDTIISGRAQGIYADRADAFGYRASGLFSHKFADDRFGLLVGLAYSKIRARGDSFISNGFVRTNNIDGNGDGINDVGLFRPNRITLQIEDRDDDRYTANAAVQFKPDDVTDIVLEGTYSLFQRERNNNFFQVLLNDNDVPGSAFALPDGTVTRATLTGVNLRPLAHDAPSELEAYNFGASATREFGRLKVLVDASFSRGTGSENQADITPGAPFIFVIQPRAGRNTTIDFDFSGQRIVPNFNLTSNFDRDDPGQFELFSVFDGVALSSNRGYDGKIDLDYEVNAGWLTSIEAGARYENIRLVSQDPQSTPRAAALLAAADRNGDGIITIDELPSLSLNNQFSGNFFPEASGNFPRSFLTGDLSSPEAGRADVGLGDPARVPASERQVQQRSLAAYLKANFDGEIGAIPFAANAGVRYIDVRRVARGNTVATAGPVVTITPNSITRTFPQFLPSANLSLTLAEDLLLRFAAAKVVSRPALRDVAPGTTVSLTNFTAAAGNPNLEPIEATQFDAALEWYFAPSSFLGVAAFSKQISTFIISQTTLQTIDGFPAIAVNPSGLFQLNSPINSTDGRVRGIEVNYQHAFRFLPAPFDGLGVQTNYTFADSRTPIVDPLGGATLPLPRLSRHTYNIVAYYENDLFTTRLAYNYRSRFLFSLDSAALGGARFEDAFGQLDLTASLKISELFRLTFDATNLNKAITRQFQGTENRLTFSAVNDTRYQFGIIGTF
jgi:TonB-dependent receptor